MTSELDCEISRQLHVGGFGNVVCANQRRPAQRTDGGNNQDATRPTLDHLPYNHLNECMVSKEVVINMLANLITTTRCRGAEEGVAGAMENKNTRGPRPGGFLVDEFGGFPLGGIVARHSNRPANTALVNGLRYL